MPDHGADDLHARFEREAIPLIARLSAKAMRLARNRHDAEDLLQETMLAAYNGFHSYEEGTNLKAWLMRIMHNRWISQFRKVNCRPAETFTADFDDYYSSTSWVRDPTGDARPAEVVALDSMLDADLHSALMTLQDDARTVVFYAYLEGLPHKEISDLLGIPAGTVMSRAHRGKRQLRGALAAADVSRSA